MAVATKARPAQYPKIMSQRHLWRFGVYVLRGRRRVVSQSRVLIGRIRRNDFRHPGLFSHVLPSNRLMRREEQDAGKTKSKPKRNFDNLCRVAAAWRVGNVKHVIGIERRIGHFAIEDSL